MKKLMSRKGFTLIELMIVVAIIGILAAIAIPQFAQLVARSNEGATKGNLGTVRSALSIYYGDTEGAYPTLMANLTIAARYLQTVPTVKLPKTSASAGHATSAAEQNTTADVGGWFYDNQTTNATTWGNVAVNCTHVDAKGTVWSWN